MKLNDLVRRPSPTPGLRTRRESSRHHLRFPQSGGRFTASSASWAAWLDGHTYAASAYKNGCRAFLCEHALELSAADAAQIITADTRAALAVIGADFYGNPADQLASSASPAPRAKRRPPC